MRGTTVGSPLPRTPLSARVAWETVTATWFAPVAALLGIFDVASAAAIVADRNGTMPGRAIGPVILLSLGCSMFVGLYLYRQRRDRSATTRHPSGRSPGGQPGAALVAALAFSVVVVGLVTGSPMVLAVGTVTLLSTSITIVVRRQSRSAPPGAPGVSAQIGSSGPLVILGALPAIGLFWLVVPPLLALVVIAGVIATYLQPADPTPV